MVFSLRNVILGPALAALAFAGCSDDGVQSQNDGTNGTTGGGASSGISTTMTSAGSTATPGDDGADDTGGLSTGSPPPDDSTSDGSGGPAPTSTSDGSGSSGSSGESSSSDGSSSSSSSTGGGELQCGGSTETGPLAVGDACTDDADCQTGVCFDYADYDPFCGGTACSTCCETNADCIAALTAAGAPNPGNGYCGPDGRCDMVGSGFGAFFCAAPPG